MGNSWGFGRVALLPLVLGAFALCMLAVSGSVQAQTNFAAETFQNGAFQTRAFTGLPRFLFSARHTAEHAAHHVASPIFPGIFRQLRLRLRQIRVDLRQRMNELRVRLRNLPRPLFGR